jgi:hypothetical protein
MGDALPLALPGRALCIFVPAWAASAMVLAQDDSSVEWNPEHDGPGLIEQLGTGLALALLIYAVWRFLIWIAKGQRERIPWRTLRYRWPTAMSVGWCVFVWVDSLRPHGGFAAVVIALQVLFALINLPVLLPVLAVLLLADPWSDWGAMLLCASTAWLAWYCFLRYCEWGGWPDELVSLNIGASSATPPAPARKS